MHLQRVSDGRHLRAHVHDEQRLPRDLDEPHLPDGRVRPVSRASVALWAALAAALTLQPRSAHAHLLPAQQGTVNVVGAELFAAVSVPTSALHDADDNGDGTLDVPELQRHEEALRAEADRRLVLRDGATLARTVRVDLILSPEHDAVGGRADHVVVLKHAALDASPEDLRVECDLFGAGPSAPPLTFTATRHPSGGSVQTEVASLTTALPEHGFFSPAPRPSGAGSLGAVGGAPGWLVCVVALLAVGLALAVARASRELRA
jgi:hypothetical protein